MAPGLKTHLCTQAARSMYIIVSALMSLSLVGCRSNYPSDLPPPTVRPVRIIRPPVLTPVQPQAVDHLDIRWEWLPPSHLEDFSRWHGIIIHHSMTDYGDADAFDRYHRTTRGWDGLGYHFVINNGKNKNGKKDGEVEYGKRWEEQSTGAHCRVDKADNNYWNEHTVGICLVGNFEKTRPTAAQWASLGELVRLLQHRYHIPTHMIKGHRDVDKTKCPGKNFSLWKFKQQLSGDY